MAIFNSFVKSVKQAEIRVRLGRWTWSPENPAPTWETLQRANLWHSERAEAFQKNFCQSSHTVTPVVTTERNKVAFNVTKEDAPQEINVLIYKNDGGKVPDTIATLHIRAGLFHVKSVPSVSIPDHLSYEMEHGMPVLLWGRRVAVDRMVHKMKDVFPQKQTVVINLFERPAKAILGSRHKFEEHRAVAVADEHTILGQVLPNSQLCCLSPFLYKIYCIQFTVYLEI